MLKISPDYQQITSETEDKKVEETIKPKTQDEETPTPSAKG